MGCVCMMEMHCTTLKAAKEQGGGLGRVRGANFFLGEKPSPGYVYDIYGEDWRRGCCRWELVCTV